MRYRVVLQRLAIDDPDVALSWAAQKAPVTARRWLDHFNHALQTLDSNPHRCPLAREHRKVNLPLREIPFGKKPNVNRAIFLIDGETVRVLRIRRAQRRSLTSGEIKSALDQGGPQTDI
jgi:hypothetical protein